MDIIKKLSLNKTPKDVQNGSIVCAKNMMVDDTGSFLTTDTGFDEVPLPLLKGDDNSPIENIVGVIPCNKEIVIFTSDNRIIRKEDNSDDVYIVDTNWHWSGGKITGTFTYNYKDELVLVVAESEATVDVPLKSFIIHEYSSPVENIRYYTSPNQTYATEEIIPKVNCVATVKDGGELVCGVYTFFIRYEIDKENYTKWFQITGDINIIHQMQSKRYSHTYYGTGNNPIEQSVIKETFNVNSDNISTHAIQLHLLLDDLTETNIGKAQIGYIIKRKGDVQGRIEGLYDLTNGLDILIRNNSYIEEEAIDSLLESPHQFYNVKNAVTYNNRLYLANYKEYDNTNYKPKTSVTIAVDDGSEITPDTDQHADGSPPNAISYDLKFRLFCDYNNATYRRDYFGTDINIYNLQVGIESGLVINPSQFIAKLAKYIPIGTEGYGLQFLDTTDSSFLEHNHAVLVFNKYLYTDPITLQPIYETIGLYDTQASGTTPSLPLGITVISDYQIEADIDTIEPDNSTLYILHNGKRYDMFGGDTAWNVFIHHQVDNISDESLSEDYIIDLTGEEIGDIRKECRHTIRLRLAYAEGTPVYTDTILPTGEDGVTPTTGVLATPSANTRTLIPYQKYNFFIHYIRPDGSCTPGFHIADKSYSCTYGNKIVPRFSAKKPADTDFVGYFISYEEVERDTDTMLIIDENDDILSVTNALYEYNLDILRGNRIIVAGVTYYITPNTLKFIENRLTENHIEFDTTTDVADIADIHGAKEDIGILIFIKTLVEARYNKKEKILYRLTRNIYTWNTAVACEDYLPDFYDRQTIIAYFTDTTDYTNDLIIDPAIKYVFGFKDVLNSNSSSGKVVYNLRYYFPQMYSKYPTSAMNVKQDFLRSAVVLAQDTVTVTDDDTTTSTTNDTLAINTVVTPDRLHDFLELQSAYKAKPSKVYINYREDNISQFNKTVYRSDVCSDESLVNGFRHFEANNYKNILENKGSITNIVGIGLYLIIHTEYSLFVFDRSPKLTQRNQLDIPDAFDIDYQEVMPANEGYGGLADKNESIITKHGYIWFDRTSKYIFRYDNGKVDIMSGDINNFIKYIEPTTVRFAEDTIHNRLMICIYYSGGDKFVTLSYNFITNTYISLHDYKFTHNYRTYNKSYVWDENIPNKLYVFTDEHNCSYGALESKQDYIFDCITSEPTEENPNNGDIRPYVDIICNEQPNVNKQLDAISYVLDIIKGSGYSFDIVKPTEENLNRRYSGRELRIYTDETDTENLDIDVKQSAPRREDMTSYADTWRYPVYDKGKWLLNYFRNRINDAVNKSDTKSLIYGKYIVARFIFNKDDRVKLENVTFKINPY